MSRINADHMASRFNMLPDRKTAIIYRRSLSDGVIASDLVTDVSVKDRKRNESPVLEGVSLVRQREIRIAQVALGPWNLLENDIVHIVDLDEWWQIQDISTKNCNSRHVCICSKTEALE